MSGRHLDTPDLDGPSDEQTDTTSHLRSWHSRELKLGGFGVPVHDEVVPPLLSRLTRTISVNRRHRAKRLTSMKLETIPRPAICKIRDRNRTSCWDRRHSLRRAWLVGGLTGKPQSLLCGGKGTETICISVPNAESVSTNNNTPLTNTMSAVHGP